MQPDSALIVIYWASFFIKMNKAESLVSEKVGVAM